MRTFSRLFSSQPPIITSGYLTRKNDGIP